MAYVVGEPCQDCKYTDCVVVCPMDCFYQDNLMLYIDPTVCIDCEACVPECPVEAIFHDQSVPAGWEDFVPLNAERSAALKANGGSITEKREPLLGPRCRKRSRAIMRAGSMRDRNIVLRRECSRFGNPLYCRAYLFCCSGGAIYNTSGHFFQSTSLLAWGPLAWKYFFPKAN